MSSFKSNNPRRKDGVPKSGLEAIMLTTGVSRWADHTGWCTCSCMLALSPYPAGDALQRTGQPYAQQVVNRAVEPRGTAASGWTAHHGFKCACTRANNDLWMHNARLYGPENVRGGNVTVCTKDTDGNHDFCRSQHLWLGGETILIFNGSSESLPATRISCIV